MGRKYLINLLLSFVSLVILSNLAYGWIPADRPSKKVEKTFTAFSGYNQERAALEGFVAKYFIHDGFVRTNLIDTKQGELASGADFLSESAGLLMLYYLKQDERQKFDSQVNLLKTYFFNRNQLFKWRIRPGLNPETVNSTVDDLRIVKALLRAAQKWERTDYKIMAQKLSARLLKNCVTGNSLKAYDSPHSPKAPFVYYDFEALRLMGEFNQKWPVLAKVNLEHILSRQVKGLPFYKDDWFSKGNAFPTVENFMVMMHLSEAGIKDPQSIAWLKEKLKRKGLFGSYSLEGKPLNAVESPAIYAITAIIARWNGDAELYALAAGRLKKMQNLNNNEYYGGFIDLKQLAAFSFDQLLALLAY
ncbi:MAG TPA: glycosyl hydrolase family 8 [Bacillota bacterium]